MLGRNEHRRLDAITGRQAEPLPLSAIVQHATFADAYPTRSNVCFASELIEAPRT
jgi:hypothetical protein